MKNKGITLIALIITIIVLLILAGITVGALTTNNSVLKQSGIAKNESEIGKEKELLQVGIFGAMTSHKENLVTEENLREEMKDYATVVAKRKKLIVTFNESQRQYEVDTVGEIKEYTRVDPSTLPVMSYSKFTSNMTTDKANVLSITFLNTLNSPTEYYKIFDVSQNNDGTVKAWLIENNENEGKYDLYVGGKDGVIVDNCIQLFYYYSECKTMDLSNFYTEGTTTMQSMFIGCSKLENLDVSYFDTKEVINMDSMFNGCKALKELDISNFNTSKVNTMHRMFYNTGLVSLDASGLTNDVCTNMSEMFAASNQLINLNLRGFNTGSATNIFGMFNGCWAIKNIDLSGFDTSNVTDMNRIFVSCTKLEDVNFSNFNMSKVTDMTGMFYNTPLLTNESLNTILLMCSKADLITTKTLNNMNISSAQASTCTGLSNYSAFTAAGWTTGY